MKGDLFKFNKMIRGLLQVDLLRSIDCDCKRNIVIWLEWRSGCEIRGVGQGQDT